MSAMVRPTTEADRRRLLADAKRVIGERYGEFGLSLTDIAEAVGCSPRQLQRVFRSVGGTDFRSYLLSVRMERARQLLSRGMAVRAAARRVGYKEASGLRQRFVSYFGAVPSDFQPSPPDYDEFWRAAEDHQEK